VALAFLPVLFAHPSSTNHLVRVGILPQIKFRFTRSAAFGSFFTSFLHYFRFKKSRRPPLVKGAWNLLPDISYPILDIG